MREKNRSQLQAHTIKLNSTKIFLKCVTEKFFIIKRFSSLDTVGSLSAFHVGLSNSILFCGWKFEDSTEDVKDFQLLCALCDFIGAC